MIDRTCWVLTDGTIGMVNQAQGFAEFFLAHAKQHSAETDARSDVNVHRVGAARTARQVIAARVFHHVFVCHCRSNPQCSPPRAHTS